MNMHICGQCACTGLWHAYMHVEYVFVEYLHAAMWHECTYDLAVLAEYMHVCVCVEGLGACPSLVPLEFSLLPSPFKCHTGPGCKAKGS